ncbi:hypothetical protein Tco_1086194 [Tanacetum coccineum]
MSARLWGSSCWAINDTKSVRVSSGWFFVGCTDSGDFVGECWEGLRISCCGLSSLLVVVDKAGLIWLFFECWFSACVIEVEVKYVRRTLQALQIWRNLVSILVRELCENFVAVSRQGVCLIAEAR